MTIIAMLQGDTSGDGFLIAPHDGRTFPALLVVRTDTGSADVTLRSVPEGRLEFDRTTLTVGIDPTGVAVHATEAGQARQDTAIEIVEDGSVVARLTVSCVDGPIVVRFRGRFEARFATEPAIYNSNPAYTATTDVVGPGWTWILEGEPPFTTPGSNVPTRIDLPVGRQIRFNDPVALRSHAEPVVTTVDGISGRTAGGTEETFTTGDPLIGEPVNLGPDTYFAGNRQPDPNHPTEETHGDQREVLGLFELHLGDRFSGASAIGPFTHMSTHVGEHTRDPDSRPTSNGTTPATAELAAFGLSADLLEVSGERIDALVTDYEKLPAGNSPERRNLRRRICHLLSTVDPQRQNDVLNAHPDFDFRDGTLEPGWSRKQAFTGTVDADLRFAADGSCVVEYLGRFATFTYRSRMFAFHSDELCAHHIGSLEPGQPA